MATHGRMVPRAERYSRHPYQAAAPPPPAHAIRAIFVSKAKGRLKPNRAIVMNTFKRAKVAAVSPKLTMMKSAFDGACNRSCVELEPAGVFP